MKQPGSTLSNLPAVAPDLLLQRTAGRWQIGEISARLAHFGKSTPTALTGRLLDQVFPQSSPSLIALLDEVAASGQDLTGVKVRLGPGADPLLADIHLQGLSEDFMTPLAQITFRSESVASRLENSYAGLIGTSPAMREVFRKIELYADADAAVVVTGETGCGKELVAAALHRQGGRHQGPFAAVNCAAISEQLLESELFGHEKGAFTGAVRSHRGHFEQASGGTLFLDEVGEMPLHTQSKLLRVLEDGRIQPVGSEQTRQVDVRVVAATNVSLERAVSAGRFRADLYHRLAVLRIHLPALRERSEDIPLLANHFLAQFNRRYQKQITRLTPEAMSILTAYLWPGNVRELRNLLERLVIETEAPAIGGRALAEWVRERQSFQLEGQQLMLRPDDSLVAVSPRSDLEMVIDVELIPEGEPFELDPATLRKAYLEADGNISSAARLLGIHRATFYRHLERCGLTRQDLDSPEP